MIPVLIAYSTSEGQTHEIARFMASTLRDAGYGVDLLDVAAAQSALVQPSYSMAILGGSVHAGQHSHALARFIEANASWLALIPVAFFSVSLTAAKQDEASRAETARMLGRFLDKTGLAPARTCRIAGALRYSRYGFIKRLLLQRIAARAGGGADTSRDYEYTDWNAVRQFTLEFARDLLDDAPSEAA